MKEFFENLYNRIITIMNTEELPGSDYIEVSRELMKRQKTTFIILGIIVIFLIGMVIILTKEYFRPHDTEVPETAEEAEPLMQQNDSDAEIIERLDRIEKLLSEGRYGNVSPVPEEERPFWAKQT